MDPRYRVASASPARAFPQRLVLTGALALALCLLALVAAAGPARAGTLAVETFVPGEVVVTLNPQSGATIQQINSTYYTQVKDTLPNSGGVYLLKLPVGKTLEQVLQDMSNDTRLSYAEPNFLAVTSEADDHGGDGRFRAHVDGSSPTPSSTQYAASALGLPCAATLSVGQGTTVAVLDTGAQLDHPALQANFEGVKHYDFVDNDRNPTERAVGLDEDGDGLKDELVGHGTHVAGIVDLVAPAAKIMPLRVLNTEGSGTAFTIAKAISYAKDNGADVINLSLGARGKSTLLRGVIGNAIRSGGVVSAAAGNESSALPHYPAAGDGTIASADGLVAVSSVNENEKKSDFANYGSWVDIAAPGEYIRSTFPVSKYAYWSGTSMATPFVAGQAALLRAVNGSLGAAGIEEKVRKSARSLYVQDPVYGELLGVGHADVCASLVQ